MNTFGDGYTEPKDKAGNTITKDTANDVVNPDKEFTKGWLLNSGDYYIPVATYSPEQIFAGNVPMLDINFISPNKYKYIDENGDVQELNARNLVTGEEIKDDDGNPVPASIAAQLQPTISSWYIALRNLAVVGLLCILVYVGIRIIISSTASDKAKYKQLFMDWLIALCLLFFLHYIMSFVITLTESICQAIAGDGNTTYTIFDETADHAFSTNLLGAARYKTQYKDLGAKLTYLIFYIALIVYTCIFTYTYLRRVLMMAFLTLIAPLVALTYPIDKMNDGKAQAFDMWLKEFVYNALIQPFHLILYTVFVGTAMDFASQNVIYMVAALAFILSAEKILRNFFGFNKAGATLGALPALTAGSLLNKALSGKGKKQTGGGNGDSDDKPARFDNHKADVGEIEAGDHVTENAPNVPDSDNESLDGQSPIPQLNMDDEENSGVDEFGLPVGFGREYSDEELQQLNAAQQQAAQQQAAQQQAAQQQAAQQRAAQQQAAQQQAAQQQAAQQEQNGENEGKIIRGFNNWRRAHNIDAHHIGKGAKRAISGVLKFGTRTAFKASAGTFLALTAMASGGGIAGGAAAFAVGSKIGGNIGNKVANVTVPGVMRIGDAAINASRELIQGNGKQAAGSAAASAILDGSILGREIDYARGNTKHQNAGAIQEFKDDPNNYNYLRDQMASKDPNGRIPSSKEVEEKMNSFDAYIDRGFKDIKEMLKAQKAEQFGINAEQSALIAKLGKDRGITQEILMDEKKLAPRMERMEQELMQKGVSQDEAHRRVDYTFNVLKAQNDVAHNLVAPNPTQNQTQGQAQNQRPRRGRPPRRS